MRELSSFNESMLDVQTLTLASASKAEREALSEGDIFSLLCSAHWAKYGARDPPTLYARARALYQ